MRGPFRIPLRAPRSRAGVLALAALVGAVGCAGREREAPPRERAIPASRATPGFVEVRAPAGAVLLEGAGRVVPTPGSLARVGLPFDLRVVAVHVAPGDSVAEGAPLVDVAPPAVLMAAAELGAAAARVEALEARTALVRDLRARELVEAERLFELETRLAEATGALRGARATLAAAGVPAGEAAGILARGALTVRAPIAGTVTAVRAVAGEVVPPGGEPLVELVGGAPARVEARFPAPIPDDAVEGLGAAFVSSAGEGLALRWPPLGRVTRPEDGAHVAWFDVASDEATAGAAAAPGALPPGLGGVVRLIARAGAGLDRAVEVPSGAVVLRGDDAVVGVWRGEARGVEAARVEVLAIDGARALVRGDVAVGDRVAADPDVLLRLGRGDGAAPAPAEAGATAGAVPGELARP